MSSSEFCPFTVPDTFERCVLPHHSPEEAHVVEPFNSRTVQTLNRQEAPWQKVELTEELLDALGRRFKRSHNRTVTYDLQTRKIVNNDVVHEAVKPVAVAHPTAVLKTIDPETERPKDTEPEVPVEPETQE